MLKYLYYAILMLGTIANLQAQEIMIQAPPGYTYIYTEQNLPKGMDGSPYLDDWKPSEIILKKGKTIYGLLVRYNVYENQMLYQNNNQTYVIGNPDSLSEIKYSNRDFIYLEYGKDEKLEKSFFEVLVNGKVCLLNKYEMKIIRSDYNVALSIGNKNDRLSLEQQLYLRKGNRIVVLNKRNSLLEFLDDKKEEVSSFLDKQHLSLKIKEDMIKVLAYYNQLQ